jgi:hypothetical protein
VDPDILLCRLASHILAAVDPVETDWTLIFCSAGLLDLTLAVVDPVETGWTLISCFAGLQDLILALKINRDRLDPDICRPA